MDGVHLYAKLYRIYRPTTNQNNESSYHTYGAAALKYVYVNMNGDVDGNV